MDPQSSRLNVAVWNISYNAMAVMEDKVAMGMFIMRVIFLRSACLICRLGRCRQATVDRSTMYYSADSLLGIGSRTPTQRDDDRVDISWQHHVTVEQHTCWSTGEKITRRYYFYMHVLMLIVERNLFMMLNVSTSV